MHLNASASLQLRQATHLFQTAWYLQEEFNMRNTLPKLLAKCMVFPALFTAGALYSVNAQAQEILARVITSTAVIQQVAVPRQVCNTAAVVSEAPKSGAGAAIGAIAGGAMGNAVGNGSGRALATMIGLVGGRILGNNV